MTAEEKQVEKEEEITGMEGERCVMGEKTGEMARNEMVTERTREGRRRKTRRKLVTGKITEEKMTSDRGMEEEMAIVQSVTAIVWIEIQIVQSVTEVAADTNQQKERMHHL